MKELYKALAAFQAEVPTIKKNASGYGYKFADLEEINNVIKPLLTKHGLGYIQPLQGTSVQTVVFHVESGESIESLTEIPQGVELKGQNTFQVGGSAITYYRRYSLASFFGLVTDEDADGAGEQVKRATAAPKAAQAMPEPKGDTPEDTLARAKQVINTELEAHDYIRADQKKTFISMVLGKNTIDNLNDCDTVMDALENEK